MVRYKLANVITHMVRAVLTSWLVNQQPLDNSRLARTTQFVVDCIYAMPPPLCWGVRALLVWFAVELKLVGTQAIQQRLEVWSMSVLRPRRLLIELIETIALYGHLADE